MGVRLQRDDFDISHEVSQLCSANTSIGAVVTFSGTVRGNGDTGPTQTMLLEHYPGMTEAELERIEADARARWPLEAVLIIHRYGELKPGDNIVLVIAASAHRQAAFEAAMFLMDFLKSQAPFWKKEVSADGQGQWVDARQCDEAALRRWSNAPSSK